ncbi:MAG: electron transfer flavoprotein subunit beta/FixA family protein [Candidatus Aminicenantes bacterium]|nr:electron transfer flavoprotein subunit beta/FixA family protein [Candidatus Aminicenantes bacterium]
MNIYVCTKQVPDTEAVLSIKDGKTINEENIKWIINPYDEYAIEEALQAKEKSGAESVTVITLGPQRTESSLRTGLAMGAQNAIHVETEEYIDHKTTAKALANAIKQDENFGIIFIGKQAIDDDSYQTHILLADYLGIPAATNVTAFSLEGDKVIVEREIDEGAKEKIEMAIPCVVGATKGLNTPRYASLMGIMKAKKVPIKKFTLQDLGIADSAAKIKPEKLYAPPEKPAGRVLEGEVEDTVKELAKLLKEEAKVL